MIRKWLTLGWQMISRKKAPGMSANETAPTPPSLTPGEKQSAGLAANEPAPASDVPRPRKSSFFDGTSVMTPELALLLEKRFGISADLWMKMEVARHLDPERDETDVVPAKRPDDPGVAN
jgi:plasmid maintenance system antidote protein VapI